MFARVTRAQGQVDRLEEFVRNFREQAAPLVRAQPGFQGAYLLVDRQQGNVLAISLWESEQAMRQSEQAIGPRRMQPMQQLGGMPMVTQYEVDVLEGGGGTA